MHARTSRAIAHLCESLIIRACCCLLPLEPTSDELDCIQGGNAALAVFDSTAPVREHASMPQISFAAALSDGTACSILPGIVWMPPDPQIPPDTNADAPRDRAHRVDSQSARLLWIDDEVRPNDAIVRLLEVEGFRVECANSGATGLAMAQAKEYAGIILDVRLPDISGITVLETLMRQQIAAPILVLTGYPDFDVAVQAMRLGAWDCQSKTILLSDKWIGLVRALAEQGNRFHNRSFGLLSADGAIVRDLLEFLEELQKRRELRQRQQGDQAESDFERLKLRLLRTLADRRVNVFLFLVLAKALRMALRTPTNALPSALREISDLVKQAAAVDSVRPDWRVQATLSKLAEAEERVGQLREEEIARTLGANRAHLGRLLRNATGFTFKQWRWGFLLRPALILLPTTREQVAQIAYSSGYESLAQFDRDFRRLLSMTPTEYRQSVRGDLW
jgi:DNA-binding response OmpR family regulator